MSFAVEHHRSSAAAFHERPVPEPARRAVWVVDALAPALVLGSTQPENVADPDRCRDAGVDIVRRRSGGGAVLVVPGEVVWVDVVVPAGDPLWDDDVGRATHWLGETWADALTASGALPAPLGVHRGGLERRPWSELVCFAGRGPGEVTVPSGAKVVGIAQRRTRGAARFQCAVLRHWDAVALVDLLALDDDARASAGVDLAAVAVPISLDGDALVTALVERLPT